MLIDAHVHLDKYGELLDQALREIEEEQIFTIAQRVIMLDKRTKGIVATGDPNELRDHSDEPWVRQFFNREAELT